MAHGPFLIFDKSSLESLNLDEAVFLDNFYMSNITPLFFVECLADLEKAIRMIFERSKEQEALSRWVKREFLDIERTIAKEWRKALTTIDLDSMVKTVMAELGHWRKPKSLADAKQIADTIIDSMDPDWLLRFGLNLIGVPESTDWVINDWNARRRPPLRDYAPYFVFMLTINIFFCVVLPTQLLSKVKPSHKVDLAYLYYLPFCSVFTSKDNFHAEIVPLFLSPGQMFVNGIELKEDLKKLVAHYSALPENVLKSGLNHFAGYPPEDTTFLTTQLWDKYLPGWRTSKQQPKMEHNPESEKQLVEELNQMTDSPELTTHDERDIDKLSYVTIRRSVRPRKGKWLRFSEEQIQRMRDRGEIS